MGALDIQWIAQQFSYSDSDLAQLISIIDKAALSTAGGEELSKSIAIPVPANLDENGHPTSVEIDRGVWVRGRIGILEDAARDQLIRWANDANLKNAAGRKKRLGKIIKALDELANELEGLKLGSRQSYKAAGSSLDKEIDHAIKRVIKRSGLFHTSINDHGILNRMQLLTQSVDLDRLVPEVPSYLLRQIRGELEDLSRRQSNKRRDTPVYFVEEILSCFAAASQAPVTAYEDGPAAKFLYSALGPITEYGKKKMALSHLHNLNSPNAAAQMIKEEKLQISLTVGSLGRKSSPAD